MNNILDHLFETHKHITNSIVILTNTHLIKELTNAQLAIEDYIYKGETIDKNYGTVITSLCFKT